MRKHKSKSFANQSDPSVDKEKDLGLVLFGIMDPEICDGRR